ncbi:MAG: outer membrane beta-barrel protein, partial [Limisphaerales bacterium]
SSRANSSWSWDFVGGSVGAEGDFTDKLTGTLQFGYQQRSSSLTGERGGAPTVTMELEQLLGRRTQISLSYTRANQVNVDAVDSTSVSDQVRLSLSRALGNRQKWFASVFASYWRNDFSASGGSLSGRSDEATSLGATLDYRIQEWMTSRLGYSFADFTSEIPSWARGGIDYQVNQVSLSVNVGF